MGERSVLQPAAAAELRATQIAINFRIFLCALLSFGLQFLPQELRSGVLPYSGATPMADFISAAELRIVMTNLGESPRSWRSTR